MRDSRFSRKWKGWLDKGGKSMVLSSPSDRNKRRVRSFMQYKPTSYRRFALRKLARLSYFPKPHLSPSRFYPSRGASRVVRTVETSRIAQSPSKVIVSIKFTALVVMIDKCWGYYKICTLNSTGGNWSVDRIQGRSTFMINGKLSAIISQPNFCLL